MHRPATLADNPVAPEVLQVYLVGPPRVEWLGAGVAVPRRQVRALVYRLAAQREPISRGLLAFLFWPDVSESESRRSLSRLLSHLRSTLPDPALLVTSRDCVSFDWDLVWSDLVAFIQLADPDGEIQSLREAVALYRGPFLTGFSLSGSPEFEAWVVEQERECERLYLGVLATLIKRYTACLEYEAAIDCAQRYLATDELAEHIHQRLIALYAAAGNRSAALRQFERCAAVLERELGVRPLPETRAVYASALDNRRPPAAPAASKPTWATLPSLEVPLVGRDAPWHQLRSALSDVQAGNSRVFLISGEPGVGKSRLLEEFATRSGDRTVVLAAAARSSHQPLPYQPVVELVRSHSRWIALTTAVEPVWLAEAARVLPELRDVCPHLPPPLPTEPDEARTRLLEALCRLTVALTAARRPLLLCLDDLHWADSATFDWLLCLARRMAPHRSGEPPTGHRPILVVGTYRTTEHTAVDDLRDDLLRLGILSELRLTGLAPNAILDIVHHLTGPRPGSTILSERLHRATGGNPFFLLETLRVLLEGGRLPNDLAALQQVPLPDTVRNAVESRCRRLDPRARQVLEAGAVLGQSFDLDLVRRTAGRGEMEAVNALETAVARQLLVEDPAGYRFQHALIRQTVEANLGPVRHQLLHRRAARALERVHPQPTAEIARHLDRAGEEEKALHFYRHAARQASDLFAWQEAEEIQGRLLELLDRLDPDRSRERYLDLRVQTLTNRAHIRFLQGRLEERDADLAALSTLAEGCGDQEMRLHVLVHRVRYLNLDAHYEEALKVAQEGLALADGRGSDETGCRLRAQIGFAHYFLGQPRQALTALEAALAAVGNESSPAMRGRITHILGYVYFHLGDFARSLGYQQEAHACHQAVGDLNRLAWDGIDIGASHLELGDLDAARTYLTDHLDLARRIGARPAEVYGLTMLGSWELQRGAYLAAVDRFREARLAQQQLRSEHGIVAAELGTGLALYHLGKLAQARGLLRGAIRRARSIAHLRRLAESLIALGLLEIAAGSPAAARSHLVEALDLARNGECWGSVSAALSALARLERTSEGLLQAVDHASEAIQLARGHQLRIIEVWPQMELGLALLARGNLAWALEHTSCAVGGVSRPHEAWIGTEEVHRAHSRVLQALGRDEQAREHARLADGVIQAKADHIPDPAARQDYLRWAKRKT